MIVNRKSKRERWICQPKDATVALASSEPISIRSKMDGADGAYPPSADTHLLMDSRTSQLHTTMNIVDIAFILTAHTATLTTSVFLRRG